MWNYLFYIAYLLNKKGNDYNGNESKLRKLIDKKDPSWFPIGKTMSYEVKQEQIIMEDDYFENINQIMTKT